MEQPNGTIPDIEDRSKIDVSYSRKFSKAPLIIIIFVVVVVTLVYGIVSFVYKNTKTTGAEVKKEQLAELIQTKANDPGLDSIIKTIQQNEMKQQQAAQEASTSNNPSATSMNQLPPPSYPISGQQSYGGNGSDNEKEPIPPARRKEAGEVMVLFENKGGNTEHQSGPINDALRGEYYANGSAKIRDDLSYLLIHGTNIACVLQTKIVTTYKGLVICQTTKDTYSADGKTLLIDRGSNIFGEQKVSLMQGQSRVFVNWTSIDTPNGVSVRIDSLGTDSLGASGAEAWVDTHFKERFGGAIMLSFLDDAFQTLGNLTTQNNGNIVYDNSSRTASNMASKALDNSINIAPTGYINQGTLMNVLIARDVDMRNIYQED